MKKYLIIILLFLFNINVFADIYKSRVCDELGHPIIGCSVTNLETGIVTYTDSEGKFSIKTAKYDSIRFSHLHYKSKEISCEKKIKTIILKDIISCKKDSLLYLLGKAMKLQQEIYGNKTTIFYLDKDAITHFDTELSYLEYCCLRKLSKMLLDNNYIFKNEKLNYHDIIEHDLGDPSQATLDEIFRR